MNVEVAGVLADTEKYVRRYISLTGAESCAIALWTFHTHAFDATDITPYVSITSAEMESGKTRLLETLRHIVARPWFTGRVTAAVLARKIDKETPTLLLDESDAAFNGDKEYAEVLRGVLNSGYERGGVSSICVRRGNEISYADLSTFCPKAIAGIGRLPDTVASRSIPIRLKRKAPGENVERMYRRDIGDVAEPIRQSLENLAAFHSDRLSDARPQLPAELRDRTADVWEPLFAVADLAGGDWPNRARAAASELSGRGSEVSETIGVELLWGCYHAFGNPEDGEPLDKLPTKELIAELCADDEAPWSTWSKGHPITPRALANLLGKFGIRSRSIRVSEDETPKGYLREAFEDAWKRYLRPLPPDLSATTPQPASLSEKQAFSIRNTNSGVADEKGPDSVWIEACGGVAAETGGCREMDGLQARERAFLADLQQLVDSGEARWVEP